MVAARRVAKLHFTDDDQPLGAEIITDPAVVVEPIWHGQDTGNRHTRPYANLRAGRTRTPKAARSNNRFLDKRIADLEAELLELK